PTPARSSRSRNGASAHSRTVLPSSFVYCLGVLAPMRRELPAAGTTTQSRAGFSMVMRGRAAGLLVALRVRCGGERPRTRPHDLIKGLPFADHAEIGARPLLDRGHSLLEILHLGSERAIALMQLLVLTLLLLDL